MRTVTVRVVTVMALTFLSVGVLAVAARAQQQRTKAYDFALKDLDGKVHRLSDYRGKVVIVDFWDTWCPPCRKEIPEFAELHKAYGDKGLVMIGVAGGRYGVEAVRSFVHQNRVPYVNLLANDEVYKGFGPIDAIPTTFVIDQQGYVYQKYVGYTPKEVFERDIKNLLARP
ncbi:MAG: TlpA disulfide reductase family protein [bacterium]|nr:TlpA family protein disulfide reductase [candidate division KSB1 bacterium]MDH7560723.1 TlpA disulfide reductase family protein [bacterium]